MSMRKVPFPVGQWTDIAAAASPVLVAGESYFLNWFENTIAYLSLTYGDDPPPAGDLGTKFFANNSPQVGTGGFSVPDTGKVWIRPQEKAITAYIWPSSPAGDGSSAP